MTARMLANVAPASAEDTERYWELSVDLQGWSPLQWHRFRVRILLLVSWVAGLAVVYLAGSL